MLRLLVASSIVIAGVFVIAFLLQNRQIYRSKAMSPPPTNQLSARSQKLLEISYNKLHTGRIIVKLKDISLEPSGRFIKNERFLSSIPDEIA